MKRRLSGRLGPRAKKTALTAAAGETVTVTVEVAPGTDPQILSRAVEEVGGTVRSFLAEAHLLTAELPAGRLEELADVEGIVQVEVRATWRH